MLTADTLTDEQIRELLSHARNSGDVDTARACYAALSTSDPIVSSWTKEAARRHCAGALNMFRAGAQVCREMMASFVEQGGDSTTAMSIRANWSPSWGADPRRPTQAPEPIRCGGGASQELQITDEQIRDLRESLRIRPSREITITECDVALDGSDGELARLARRLARARCAEILNARATEAK